MQLLSTIVFVLFGIRLKTTDAQFKGPNIALGKPAFQSPGDYCDEHGPCYDASLAVNGGVDSDGFLQGNCSHTVVQNTRPASWSVEFQAFYEISGIKVYNRKSVWDFPNIGKRLRGFNLTCTVNKQPTKLLYTDMFTYDDATYPVITNITLSDFPYCSGIAIEIPLRPLGEDTLFSLCEVEVFSDRKCQELLADPNGYVSFSNELNFGSIATFNCSTGYIIFNNNQSVCDNWDWTQQAPSCKKVYCPRPPAVPNGNYTISDYCQREQYSENGQLYLPFNCFIQPVCNVGFNAIGGQRTCLETGNWSNQEAECQLTTCTLPAIDNGTYVFQNRSLIPQNYVNYMTPLLIRCNTGFKNTENSISVCSENGTITGPNPICDIVKCAYPSHISNGDFYHENGSLFTTGFKNYSESIQFQCKSGYMITNGSKILTCNENGDWSNNKPVCSLVTCPPLGTLQNILYNYSHQDDKNMSNVDSYVNVSCLTGTLSSTSSSIRHCTEQGTWDGEEPFCTAGNTEKESANVALIAGAAGGGGGALIIVVVLIVLYRRGLCSKRKADKDNRFNDLQQIDLQKTEERTGGVTGDHADTAGAYSEIKEIDRSTPNTSVYQNEPITRSEAVNYTFVNEPASQIPKSAIPVKDLSDLVLTGDAATEKFKKEFESLADGLKGCQKEAVKSQNKGKNRYRDLYAYDTTRVVLEVESDTDTDYINACYVDGFRAPNKFIASQGPTKEIIPDFWRMIWQTKCSKIVMLTNLVELGKPKCDQYWPDQGSAQYGTVTVAMTELDTYTDFVIRKFTLKKEGVTSRVVTQFHYTAWPDKGVPKYASSLVQFQNKVKHTNSHAKGPVVVHCSAGVGRTGTYIVLDYITDQAKEYGYVDVYGCVKKLREQRVKLVQMLEQYVFVHHAAVETLMLSSSALPSSQFQKTFQQLLEIDGKKKKRKLDIEFEMLKKLSPVIAEDQYVSAKDIKNRTKNRYSNVLPVEEFMPSVPTDTDEEIYVNAVFLPSYKEKKAFIITQTPLNTTKSDFWRLVWEHDVHSIVMMNNINEMKEDEMYWPNVSEKVQFEHINVTNDSTMTLDLHTVSSLTVTSFAKKRSLRLFLCGGWAGNAKLPDSPGVLLSLLEMVQSWQRQTGNHSILVHCMNGAEKSGLFCVVSAVIDRMKIEQAVAISHTIEDMRNAREQIIPSAEQYKFCHDVVLRYIQMNDTYSNFV